MTESKIRMFVINNSENITIKSTEVNVSKDADFKLIEIDEESNVVIEDTIVNES